MDSMISHESTPLILFSGLAAGANVFAPQKLHFPQLMVPGWPIPSTSDTLDSYCERLADDLRLHGHSVIGGASFGGIIALHVAKYLDPLAVVLIGSIRSPSELPGYARWARPLRSFIRFIPVWLLQLCLAPMTLSLLRRPFPHLSSLASQFRNSDPTVFKWSLSRILDWDAEPEVACPVFHIHGDCDYVLPCRHTVPGVTVTGGGHLISLTHPTEVNDFLRSVLTQVAVEAKCRVSAPILPPVDGGALFEPS